MLDLEVFVAPDETGLDIVSLADMKKHLRIIHTKLDDVITDAVEDAADKLHGIGGELNRSVFPVTWKRWMDAFPGNDDDGNPKPILLPFPPLIEVLSVTIEDGSSPSNNLVENTDYVVKSGVIVPEIHPVTTWPTDYTAGPRAISVTYRAGYTDYPKKLARMVKFLAGHYFENLEATIQEPRQMQINRRVEFAMDDLRAALRVPVSYDDFNE